MTSASLTLRHAIAAGVIACSASVAHAQTLGPDFSSNYAVTELFAAPGVPTPYGGVTLKDGDPNTLLVVGPSNSVTASIYEVPVTRDTDGHINGYAGGSTVLATAPTAEAGLRYGPGGVLFYTTYPGAFLGQIKPGSTSPDKIVDMVPLGVTPSTGGISFVPTGFPNAGHLKVTSYGSDEVFDAELVPDGNGTYDVINVTLGSQLGPVGAESIIFVDSTAPAFNAQSVLICEWYAGSVGAYEIDANGNPIDATRRDFFDCCAYWALGGDTDPTNGDFIISDYGCCDNIVIVKTIPGPFGMNYCGPAIPNSSGMSAFISGAGSLIVGDNDVLLQAGGMPQSQFGYFLNSMTQAFTFPVPNSQGALCVGGQIGRYNANVFNTGTNGMGSLQLDLANTPTPTGTVPVQPGETWNFTCWFRDNNPGSTSNFSDGLSVLFN